jgi:phospholipid-translocating ATPase
MLAQVDEEGEEHPIAYYSRKLLPRQEHFSTVEKECLAIKLGGDVFRVYLLGRFFTIQTDHRCLEWLDRMKGDNARLTRWSRTSLKSNIEQECLMAMRMPCHEPR